MLDNCACWNPFVINESTSTNPVCAKHHIMDIIRFFGYSSYSGSNICHPVKASLLQIHMHAANLDPTHLSPFSQTLILCVGKHCFGLDIHLFEHRICSKGSVVHEDFPDFFQSVFSQLHCVSCVSTLAQFWNIVFRQAFRLHLPGQIPKTSFLSPFSWRLPGVHRQTDPPGRSKVDDGTISAQHSTKERRKHRVMIPQSQSVKMSVPVGTHDAFSCTAVKCRNSLFSNTPSLHFFFQIPILIVGTAQEHSRPQKNMPLRYEFYGKQCCTLTRSHNWLFLWILLLLLNFFRQTGMKYGISIHEFAIDIYHNNPHCSGQGTSIS